MRAPPAKPFGIISLACLGLFIVWGIVGAFIAPQLSDPARQEEIARIILPIAFALFLVMGFCAVPPMVHGFFLLFFAEQKAARNLDRPFIRRLQDRQATITAVLIYAVWTIFVLGTLIGAPVFWRNVPHL